MMKILPALVLLLTGVPVAPAADDHVDFTRDIRPILSNKCFHCHGPDEAERQGGLRLDTKIGAFAETDSGEPAIVPGKVDESELYRRIVSTEDYEQMPPPESGMKLEPGQAELIRKWIEQGAEYAGHWAYQPPQRAEFPEVQNQEWSSHPVDRFILARLEKEGLQPQPEADRNALIRRLSLDLTGLPPTPEEVQQFVNDPNPNAYETLVDELLSRATYGEHWARMWLDLARYADSAGYADDPPRTIWAFRDYVIRSLNENKPFDQFTIEQIAGDLLETPSEEQLIATAFHRNTLTNNEGGTIDEEFRNAAIVDRVNTTFAVWMGTTMACAQCHTHKYDPISQREYFQLFAIFNNTADADKRDESPLHSFYTHDQLEKQKKLKTEQKQLQEILKTPTPETLASFKKWQERLSRPINWQSPELSSATSDSGKTLQIQENGTITAAEATETATYQITVSPNSKYEALTGIKLKSVPEAQLPQQGAGHGGGNFVLTNVSALIRSTNSDPPVAQYVRVELPGQQKMLSLAEIELFSAGKNIALQGTTTQSSTAYNGPAKLAIDGNTDGDYHKTQSTTHTKIEDDPWWELDLGSPVPVEQLKLWNRTDNGLHTRLAGVRIQLLDRERKPVWQESLTEAPNPNHAFAVSTARPVEFVAAYADYNQPGFPPEGVLSVKDSDKTGWAVGGAIDQSHELTLILKQPVTWGADEELVLTLEQKSKHTKHVLGSFALELTSDSRLNEISRVDQQIWSLIQKPDAERTEAEANQITQYYLAEVAPQLKKERQRLSQIEKSLDAIKPYTVPVQQELPQDKQRETHIQLRGNYASKGDAVSPGLPEVLELPGYPEDPTRLELARWLVDDQNPLTPRVIANRYWEKLFGMGLVSTSEEFGSQGELPTHPELLDWLATELVRLDWNMKAFIRLLVTSQAYRQDSRLDKKLKAIDPANQLISRGPRFRLTAEMVRDQALFVSGLLSPKMYGPPVKPPQPNIGLNAAFGGNIDWKTSEGEDKHRRGLYTTWRRSNPYPSMAAFDAPNRETCLVRRDRTNTPLQAFVTLNDPVYVEAAQALGRRMADHSEHLDEQLTYGFELCLSRKPSDLERNRLRQLYEAARESYRETPEQAKLLATDPIGELPAGADPAEFAAWTLVGNVMLNLDEMLMKP